MRPLFTVVSALCFLAAVAVVLIYMTGNTIRDGESTAFAVIGCLIAGAASASWAQPDKPGRGKSLEIEIGK